MTKKVACAVAKILTRPGYALMRTRLRAAIAQGDQFGNPKWTRHARCSLANSGLLHVANLGEDTPCDNHQESAPWRRDGATFSCSLPEMPRTDVVGRRIHGELQIARLAGNDTIIYFTDVSVDPDTGRSGAAFVCNGEPHLWRLSDGCSSLQT